MQYGDCARLQRERLAPEQVAEWVRYWRVQLAGVSERLDLPADPPAHPGPNAADGHLDFPLPAAAMQALRELASAEGVTVFVVLLAAFQVLLMRLSGQDDIVVGSPFVGRETADSFPLIGYFSNILPLRADFADNPSFRQLLQRTRAVVMGALEHQDLPFPKLVEALLPRRTAAHAPFFQVTFDLLQDDGAGASMAGLQRDVRDLPVGSKEYDLTFTVRAGLESAALAYNATRFTEATVRGMTERFQRLLDALARDPGQPVTEVVLLTDAEQEAVLRSGNDTARPVPEKTVHELFAEQAASTPAAIALDGQAGTLTYRELNERANRLAHALRRRGVAPGMLVGVALDRSPDLAVALLGILKTGAAYAPLDPKTRRRAWPGCWTMSGRGWL